MNQLLDACRDIVRGFMRGIARFLNKVTRGRLSPNFITIFGLLMHIPIAVLIGKEYFGYAAIFLIFFGLFDTLDGELARLQKRASAAGMLLDASTDRIKEVLLYTGSAAALACMGYEHSVAWAVAACGSSLCVSYIKAKGETAVKDSGMSADEINRLFQDGLGRFEIRMFTLVIGLFVNQLFASLVIITILSTYTAIERLIKISRKLT